MNFSTGFQRGFKFEACNWKLVEFLVEVEGKVLGEDWEGGWKGGLGEVWVDWKEVYEGKKTLKIFDRLSSRKNKKLRGFV
jgi:hypothetical protein